MASGSRVQSSGVLAQFRTGAVETSRFQTAVAAAAGSVSIFGFDPPSGTAVSRTQMVMFSVTGSAQTPAYVSAWGVTADGTGTLVWNGATFVGPFVDNSLTSSLTGGSAYSASYGAPGWPSSAYALHVRAVSTAGVVTLGSASYTVTDAPAAPVITITPEGGGIRRGDTVTVRVTDDEGGGSHISFVSMGALTSEGVSLFVCSGSSTAVVFGTSFDAASSRSVIANGYDHALVYDAPGWSVSSFTLGVTAVDAGGRSTVTSSVFFVGNVPERRVVDLSRFRKVYPFARSQPRIAARPI